MVSCLSLQHRGLNFLLVSLLLALVTATAAARLCDANEQDVHPILCDLIRRQMEDPHGLTELLKDWATEHGLRIDLREGGAGEEASRTSLATSRNLRPQNGHRQQQLPVVFAHGMGDSCFNSGFQHLVSETSELLGGVYTVCIPTGKTQSEDTQNGYFLNMNANVDVFAEAVQADPQLRNGFHAVGLSQGNNVIRGYMTRFNDPAVDTFISINGVNAGEGAVPHCRPKSETATTDNNGNVDPSVRSAFSMCELLMEQASHRAYTDFSQEHSFQANYWRDPRPSMKETYQKFSQLAIWNNEVATPNETYTDNYLQTRHFVWVLATHDTMVWPAEGEQWGAPDPADPFHSILPMKETEWYQKDLFGLRTAQEQGRNFFEQFEGDHLQFSMDDYERWLKTYLM